MEENEKENGNGRDDKGNAVRLGVVGLGVMGTEMLGVAWRHPEFEVVLAADPGAPAVERARAAYPGVTFTPHPEEVLDHEGIDAVYVASPPSTHAAFAIRAMKAGKAVFAEKPLAVDPAEGEEMVAVAAATGAVNALNFALSDRSAALAVGRALRAGEAGEVRGVDMRFSFPQWPRAFQQQARWVAGREQGGFLREVASHYLFLTDRLLGPLSPVHTQVTYGEAAEVAARGLFLAGDVPVSVSGQVAAGPETYEWTLHGSRRSYRITDWGDLWAGDASGWTRVEPDGPRGSEETRLSGFARAVRGEDPRGPGAAPDDSAPAGFAAGLRVQRIVEHFHRESR